MFKKYNGMNLWLLIAGSLIVLGYIGVVGLNVFVGVSTVEWAQLQAVFAVFLGVLSAVGAIISLVGLWLSKINPLVTCLSGAAGIVFGLWYFMPVLNVEAIWLVIVAVLLLADYGVTRAGIAND